MSLETKPQVSVIIVNFNTAEYLIACLNSLQKQTQVLIEIIVVDNASTDNSIDLLKSVKMNNLKIITSKVNLGFGRANNLAAESASAEYLLLLNPDTELDSPTTIAELLLGYKNSGVGLLAPLIKEPRKNKFVYPRYKYPGQKYTIFTQLSNLPGNIAWVLGACMFISSNLYDQLQGFDSDFFLYGEDVDICIRVRKLGFKIGFDTNIQIMHIGGASEFKSQSLDKWMRKRNGAFLFYKKHYHPLDLKFLYFKLVINASVGVVLNTLKNSLSIGNKEKNLDQIHRGKATLMSVKDLL